MHANEKSPIGVVGVGWVGLVTAGCFAELGHPVIAMDVDADKVETLRAGGTLPIHEPELPELVDRNRERLEFTTEMGDVLGRAKLLFCCVDTPPTYSGDADLSRVEAVVATLPDGGEHALVMKSTVPAGTGAAIRRSNPDLVYVSCPEFLKEGTAVRDFLHPDRVVIGADPGAEWAADAVAEVYAPARRRGGAHRRRLGGDDQARLERVPGDEDLVHQRDRQRLRGGRGGRHRGRRRDGTRRAHRPEVPQRRDRVGRQLLRQGHDRAQEAGREHRVSLPAAERRDRRQRTAEAPRGGQAQGPSGRARGSPDRAPRPCLQAEHRRHARRLEPRARGAPTR